MGEFIKLKDISKKKELYLNAALLQNFRPQGKSRIKKLLEKSKDLEITEVVIALSREPYYPRGGYIHYFLSSRTSEEVCIADWGSFSLDSNNNFWEFLAGKLSQMNVGVFAQGNVLRSPLNTNIFLLEDNTSSRSHPFPYLGVEKLPWDNNKSNEAFWYNPDNKVTGKSRRELEFMFGSKTSPVATGWNTNTVRSLPISPTIPMLARHTGGYYSEKFLPQIKAKPQHKTEPVDPNTAAIVYVPPEQPDYKHLPKLEYFYYIERSFSESTTIVELQKLKGKYYASWVASGDVALSSPDLQVRLINRIRTLEKIHREELNLEGDIQLTATKLATDIKFFTNDDGLSFPTGELALDQKKLKVQEIKLNYVGLDDPLQFSLEKGLRRIRSAIADDKIIFNEKYYQNKDAITSELYLEQSLRQFAEEIRGLIVLFSQI